MTTNKVRRQDPDVSVEYNFSGAKRGVYSKQAKKSMRYVIVSDAEDRARQDSQKKASKKTA